MIPDCLASSHHGKGIMTSAIRVMMDEWAIPRMNAQHIVATAFIDNIGSQRTFTKNGFRLVEGTGVERIDLTHKVYTLR